MPSQHAAYYLIEPRLEEYCQKLIKFPKSVFWVHETVIANYLGIPTGKAGEGQSEALTSLISCIKAGYGGNRKKKTKKSTSIPNADLKDANNALGVCIQQYGKKEVFKGGELADQENPVKRAPRWFHFGGEFPIRVQDQVLIVNQLTGECDAGQLGRSGKSDAPAVLPIYVIRRRRKLFKAFFRSDSKGTPYSNFDVPAIASKFRDVVWDNIEMTSTVCRRRSFHPADLEFIKDDFRVMLVASNILGTFRPGDNDGYLHNKIGERGNRVRDLGGNPPSRSNHTDRPSTSSPPLGAVIDTPQKLIPGSPSVTTPQDLIPGASPKNQESS